MRIMMVVLSMFVLDLVALKSNASADERGGWGYSGPTGPENWSAINTSYAACTSGKHQSPIDIRGAIKADLPQISFSYKPSKLRVINNGHTFQVNYDAGSAIRVDGVDFELKQFHFHSPSENHVNGRSYPLEAHLVHADKQGNLAVLAVLFEDGSENTFLELPWRHMPAQSGPEISFAETINVSALLPKDRGYYRFSGSLTTPPCTEGVRWLVLKQPVRASIAQIAQFKGILSHPNNRPIQMANARAILK